MGMDRKIQEIIASENIELLDEIKLSHNHYLYKIAKTRPLTVEQIFIEHGKDQAIAYIEICNEIDGEKIQEELNKYIVYNR